MPFPAPNTDFLDAYMSGLSGRFIAPDHEIISGFSAPDNDLSFGASIAPDIASEANNPPPVQGFSAGNLTADDWEHFLSGITPADSDSGPALPVAAHQSNTPRLDPNKLAYDRLVLENNYLGDPGMQPGNSYLTAIANNPKDFLERGTVAAPFIAAGKILGAAADDAGASIGTTLAGHPELASQQGGNLYHLFTEGDDTPTPQEQVLHDISAQHPMIATTGKVAQGVVESLPMMAAGMPEGILGKLLGAAFTAQMINSAGAAATDLGSELGKPREQRDPDKITSALSDLLQAGTLAPGMGAHTLSGPVGERFFPRREAIDRLAQQLQSDPFKDQYGRNLVNLDAIQNNRIRDQAAQVVPMRDSGVIPVDLSGLQDAMRESQLKPDEPVPTPTPEITTSPPDGIRVELPGKDPSLASKDGLGDQQVPKTSQPAIGHDSGQSFGLLPTLEGRIPIIKKWVLKGGDVHYHPDGGLTFIRKDGVAVHYNNIGYPDMTPHLYTGDDGLNQVTISLTDGKPWLDKAAANAAAGFKKNPAGYTWHHHEIPGLMQLIKKDVNQSFPHRGGVSINKNK